MSKQLKWTEERTATLVGMFPANAYVTQAQLAEAAEALETTPRSISSKLRKLGYNVQLASEVAKGPKWSEEETARLVSLLENNPGTFTFGELAEQLGGDLTAKQVQGKVLSLELNANVRPTPKAEAERKYSEQEEAQFISMVDAGAYIEEIADALGKTINSIRGKALSLLRSEQIACIPKQKESKAVAKVDQLEALDVANMTVAQIAEALDKTEKGVKGMLTRRGLTASDYDGAAKAAKAAKQGE